MLEMHMLKHIQTLLSGLHADIRALDRDDEHEVHAAIGLHISEFENMSEGVVVTYRQWALILTRQPRACLYCSAAEPGAEDILLLASTLIARTGTVDRSGENYYSVYRRILRGDLSGVELTAAANDYQIRRDLLRAVMLFHIPGDEGESAYEILRDIVPLERTDVLIDMDRHSVVLVRDIHEDDSVKDSIQFAQALQETVMSETALEMLVGISEPFILPEHMGKGYRQARDAIAVGRRFIPEQTIFAYRRLILERFLMRVPESSYRVYQDMIFNAETEKLFNEEMLYTIDVFFKKDLSLAEASRSLYIHRNTLIYRLDKVERVTGLNLRKFEDAVVFKLFMELKKERTGATLEKLPSSNIIQTEDEE